MNKISENPLKHKIRLNKTQMSLHHKVIIYFVLELELDKLQISITQTLNFYYFIAN